MPSRTLPDIELTREERTQLIAWTRSSKTSQSLALRARIVLACAHARANREVAQMFHVTPQTVGKWRARFLERRLEGLKDDPRSGAPRRLDDNLVSRLVQLALETTPPRQRLHWSSRALAEELGVSQSTVSRVWRTAAAQPQGETLRLTLDPLFVEKVRDILGLYIDPPLKVMALCVDEKHASAHAQGARIAAPAPAPGAKGAAASERRLFQALGDVTCGRAEARRPAGSRALLRFLKALDAGVPLERTVHVVIDDKGHRSRPTIAQWFARKPRFRLHVVPSCVSWVAQVQRWFAVLKERQARDVSAGDSATALEQALRAHFPGGRTQASPFFWVKEGGSAEGSSASLQRISDSPVSSDEQLDTN